jgi:hypothetical protein
MTATSVSSARRALLAGLVDHAALFPPASMDLPAALRADDAARGGPFAWMLGRFLCPASQLPALGALRPWEALPALGAVLDGAGRAGAEGWLGALDADLELAAAAQAAGARIELVEVPLPAPELAAEGAARLRRALPSAAAHLEVALDERTGAALAAVAAAGARAKVRCGGVTADAFPSVERLAAFVAACRDLALPFKATAGLHHPVRHTDPATGLPMHGFLNLLAAAALAHAHRAGREELEAVLAEEDPAALHLDDDGLAVHGRRVDPGGLAATRRELFASYGSCSFDEPVEDLLALGLLAR